MARIQLFWQSDEGGWPTFIVLVGLAAGSYAIWLIETVR